jgi:hypothetical protein
LRLYEDSIGDTLKRDSDNEAGRVLIITRAERYRDDNRVEEYSGGGGERNILGYAWLPVLRDAAGSF